MPVTTHKNDTRPVTNGNAAPVVVQVPSMEATGDFRIDPQNDDLIVTFRQVYELPNYKILPTQAVLDFAGPQPLEPYRFVTKYGIFLTFPDALPVGSEGFAVPVTWGLEPGYMNFRTSIPRFQAEREKFKNLLEMGTRLHQQDPATAREIGKQLGLRDDDPSEAWSAAISKVLNPKSRLLLEDFSTVIIQCDDVLTGLYALLLRGIVIKHRWATCLRCRELFTVQKDKEYCTPQCQQAEKQKRYRLRKEEAKKAALAKKKQRRAVRQKVS
jgi:hypothetical protein